MKEAGQTNRETANVVIAKEPESYADELASW